jgi:hypothetical protein
MMKTRNEGSKNGHNINIAISNIIMKFSVIKYLNYYNLFYSIL